MSKKFLIVIICVCKFILGDDVSEYVRAGKIYGHVGGYYQYMTGNRANFADLNASFAYRTPSTYRKFGFGGSIWLAGRVYEYTRNDFLRTKRNGMLSEIYLIYGNEYMPIRARFGRFHLDSEWIKHYNTGAHAEVMLTPFVRGELAWAAENAYVTYYRMTDFRNPYGYLGVLYGALHLSLPQSIPQTFIKVHPYFYFAPDRFVAFGLKIEASRQLLGDSSFFGTAHLLSYIGSSNQVIERSSTDGDSAFIWLEGGLQLIGMKFGGGLISISNRGVAGIDSFGQSSRFERREGLFYQDAFTLYGFLEYTFKNQVILESAVRTTIAGGRQVFNWEANAKFMLEEGLQVGAGAIGMINQIGTIDDNIFDNDGARYLLGRVFVQYSF